jgi:phosphoglycerol transferase MdoB-like AlkP superfamily enzyme
VFVIVADHCASSAGKTKLPVDKYLIPAIFYSPKHIQPGKIDTLASQIDLPPTLLGLLNFSYSSKFFGRDVLGQAPEPARAFISNYQELGLLENGKLQVLSPLQAAQTLSVDMKTQDSAPAAPDANLERDAIAWYQVASDLFNSGGYGWSN